MKLINISRAFLLLIGLSGGLVVDAGQSNVLIVNTDNSVYRYNEIAKEFKEILNLNKYHWSEFNLGQHPDAENRFKELLQSENPSIIYCIGTKAYIWARNFAPDKKLVFSAAINWRRLGITEKTNGVANELSPAQEIALVRYFFPSVKKIGLLYNGKYSREYVEDIEKEAVSLGVEIVAKGIDNAREISGALDELLPRIDIFWIISDPAILASKESVQQIFQSARQHKKPVYAYSDIFIQYGAVLSLSADMATIGRQSANLLIMMDTNKIPTGTVQIPAGSSVTLNKCTIDELKLDFNRDTLDSVNKIVNCAQ